ncbi:unnamed protein product [Heligmosomoides polygyrus]|uniref:DNA-directed DNA polymerase n=1 Tax=Heligmosomoides polygyrus TaxID=6339 RepID=A0A183GR65_HELPZ|nr:unnamed protein product [Heligmosomoides polygyrus]
MYAKHVVKQLDILGYRKVLSFWAPHELLDSDKACRISVGREFDDRRQLETEVSEFFSSQHSEFWRKGIERLPDRWAGP